MLGIDVKFCVVQKIIGCMLYDWTKGVHWPIENMVLVYSSLVDEKRLEPILLTNF